MIKESLFAAEEREAKLNKLGDVWKTASNIFHKKASVLPDTKSLIYLKTKNILDFTEKY